MERYSSRTIDELGRIVLHSDLRKRLKMKDGDSFSLTLVDTLLLLQKSEGNQEDGCVTGKINELGMIDLPKNFRQNLNWKDGDAISVYNADSIIILKSDD